MSDPTPPLSRVHQRNAAYLHLRKQLPHLKWLFDATGEVALPEPSRSSVAESLVRIVVGQMLSIAAARTILGRLIERAAQRGINLYELPEEDLRAAGVSGRKAKTIGSVAEMVKDDADRFEAWRSLNHGELQEAVKGIWGLGDWSAAMLSIFEFGRPDVFPLSDGSLMRAKELVEKRCCQGELRHDLAAPYRSFLALTLWRGLDERILKDEEDA